jgi:hypothetical protein
MFTIHFDYLFGDTAIVIFTLLAVSIGIVAEMHRDHPP